MVKGINKQIIEIKCPDDEFFEKALLFVRADKTDLPYTLIAEHSSKLFGDKGGISRIDNERNNLKMLKTAVLFLMIMLAAALSACVWLVLR